MPRICSDCQTPVTEELPGGLCPSCLLKIARKHRSDEAATRATGLQLPGMKSTPTIEELAQHFPELEIIELIGQGGMGAVYKAKQRNLDRLVALKIFLYRSDDPEFAERFKREARALGKLNHPNIVVVHSFGVRDTMHFLLMEYVDGLNLRQVTQEETLDPVHAMQLVPDLCDALQYAHSEGVIHRDIKPENILLDTRGRIKIADFGLAKIAGGNDAGLTQTQQVMGTWNYMAPEQKERPTEVDHRADIYSLGVVIYEMLTGELPLGRFRAPSEKVAIDSRLDEVVLRALEKEPERRYQQASEFKSGFATYADAAPVAAAAAAAMAPAAAIGATALHNRPVAAPPVKAMGHDRTNRHTAQGARFHICLMSGREKKGNWIPGEPNIAFTMMGGSCLDLTDVEARDVSIVSFVMMGGIEIVVPHGAIVDVDGLIIMGATDEKVKQSEFPVADPMRVRIRSFGMMGGCEVRTTKRKNPHAISPAAPVKTKPRKRRILARTVVFLAQAIATLVTIAVPIIFLMGAFDIISDRESKMIGTVAAISIGLFWIMTSHVRDLVKLPSEDASDEEVAVMHAKTTAGTLVRMLATPVLFACPIMFVINTFEGNQQEIKFAAIVAAIVGVGLFVLAGHVDKTLKGE